MIRIDLGMQRHALTALLAAALFGASVPFAKLLLGETSPLVLAGLLYLGSGAGLWVVRLARRDAAPAETPLRRADWKTLAGAVLAGGIAAPVLLLWGLSRTPGTTASLLLNLEGVLTTLVAALAFREAVGRRVWIAAAVMLTGGLVLTYRLGTTLSVALPAAAIVAACLAWAVDNNLTRKISGADPTTIAMVKGLVAGSVNLCAGLALDASLPAPSQVAGALLLGLGSYGISLVLFIHALRHLGSARAGAHFGTAPFIGAAVSVPLLGEPVTAALIVATLLMAAATWLVMSESHAHGHQHDRLVHAHRHVHDAHHEHAHANHEQPEPHAHEHVHDPLAHEHPHLPDLHHRHRH